jgi:hypothetical protein
MSTEEITVVDRRTWRRPDKDEVCRAVQTFEFAAVQRRWAVEIADLDA